MGRLKITTDALVSGPFQLGKEELLELDSFLQKALLKLNEARTNKLKLIEQNRTMALNALPENEYLEKTLVIDIEVVSESEKKKLTDYKNIFDIWKDPKSENFPTHSLRIEISNGGQENELKIDIASGWNGYVKYKLRCTDENILEDLKYELDNWIDKYKPKTIIKIWDSLRIMVSVLGVLMLLIYFGTLFYTVDYQYIIQKQANNLIDSGINQSNLPHAVDLMLKLQTKYQPHNFIANDEFDSEGFRVFLIFSVILIIIIIGPKTVIGIGNGIWKVKFYKFWIKFTMYTIPAAIFLPKIIEIIQKFIYK